MSNFWSSKKTRVILWIIGAIVVVLLIFGGGMAVGYQRGIFSSRFGENYYQNFRGGDASAGGAMMLGGPPPMNQHGTVGTVIDIDASNSRITATDPDGDEELIALDADTVIRRMDETISIVDINPGDQVVVIGEPNADGQIQARFIRIFSGSSSLPQMPPQGQ